MLTEAQTGTHQNAPTLSALTRVSWRIGILSFGGPAGQIALMHREFVDEQKWLTEKQFLHALNFCMLLPGPEAMQLATYSGWLLHGVRGGLIAGALFILPGAFIIAALSWLYVALGDVPAIEGILFGLKAAVLAIVVQALWKVAGRALTSGVAYALAICAFFLLAVVNAPFPMVVLGAGLIGLVFPHFFSSARDDVGSKRVSRPWRHLAKVGAVGIVSWGVPVAALVMLLGKGNVFADLATFFSVAAVVTFGGAYAVLSFVAQQAVETYGWLQPDEMITGLGLAETTPGPLILVLEFVGFVAGYRADGMTPILGGLLGAIITIWVTFVPCFLWIFAGAPFIEALRGNERLSSALAAITAAVVGVIANLALWFGIHALFRETERISVGFAQVITPVFSSADPLALVIAIIAAVMVWRGASLFWVLGTATAIGAVATVMGA